jgi:hypothetical protein
MESGTENGLEIPRAVVWGGDIFYCLTCDHWHWQADELIRCPGVCGDCLEPVSHPDPRVS